MIIVPSFTATCPNGSLNKLSLSLPACLLLSIPPLFFSSVSVSLRLFFALLLLCSFVFFSVSRDFLLLLFLHSTVDVRCSSPLLGVFLVYVSFSCYDRFLPSSCTDAYTPSSSPSPSSPCLSAPTRSQNPKCSILTPPHAPSHTLPQPNQHSSKNILPLTHLSPKNPKILFPPTHSITQSHISRAPRVAPPSSRVPDSPTLRSRLWRTKRRRDGGRGRL